MKAVDTNVLARYLLNDDPVQSPRAAQALAEPSYVSDTVLVETAWLLASRYCIGRALLAETLTDLLHLPAIAVSDPALVAWAIERFAQGADFADMMHLLSARHTDGFLSFEKDLAKVAGPDAPLPVETLA